MEKWISIEDASEHLGVKTSTIRDWIRKGKDIPAHKVGKQWKFKYSEIDDWVESGRSAEVGKYKCWERVVLCLVIQF